ncbi:MAG: polysaccharide lyase 6 family protein [Paludibacter sp.]
MNFKVLVFLGILLCVSVTNLFSQEQSGNKMLVSTISELNKAIVSAKPGQSIVMKDGTWKNSVINFNSTATASAPITLCAQTPGKVVLSGNSTLTFSAPYLVVDGLIFKNGFIESGSVITFQSDNCRLTNTIIKDYNPDNFKTAYYWVYFQGSYNRMDHCLFKGKSNMNPVVQNYEENARYNKVDSCIVKDIPYVKHANGREIFRIFGYGHADQTGDDGAYFTIEYNLFNHADGEGTEIISLKSNNNIVRYNTVIASRGGLVGRRGKNNTFEGNFIFGQGQEGTTGIRVGGANHRVINNYITDVTEDGLRLITGEYYEKSLTNHFAPKKKDLPKYIQVENGYFASNTIINCGGFGIDVGYNYQSHWPDLQMILMPQNNRVVNNVVYNCKENAINIAIEDKKPPLDIFQFKPNVFEGNIIWGSKMNVTIPDGVKLLNPKFTVEKDGFYRPGKNSPLINGGVVSDVKTDMDGQNRINNNGVGADEISTEKIIHHPMKSTEVGPKWMNVKK